jgi:hypothetical protein
MTRKRRRRGRGRPKGSVIPLERHRQRHQVAIWTGFRMCGYGPIASAYEDRPVRFGDYAPAEAPSSGSVKTSTQDWQAVYTQEKLLKE